MAVPGRRNSHLKRGDPCQFFGKHASVPFKLRPDPNNVEALASLFHSLPVHSPVQPQHFGLTQEDVFRHDLQLWRRRAAASNDYSGTIVDISNSP